MTEHDRQFDDLDRDVSDRLREDLRGLFQPPGTVPARVDKIILDQAKQRLAQPRRLIIRLRWAAGIAAAAAGVTIGVVVFNPQSEVRNPQSSLPRFAGNGMSNPQSGSPRLARNGMSNPQSTSPVPAEGRADVDGNGRVDILDAFQLARRIETRGPADPTRSGAADTQWDLNGDGRVDKDDVSLVASAAVRLDKGA